MVWSAAAGRVGLVGGRFQRRRMGALDQLQTSDLAPVLVTSNICVLVHNLCRDLHGTFILKDVVLVLVVHQLLVAGLVERQEGAPGFMDFYLCIQTRNKPPSH